MVKRKVVWPHQAKIGLYEILKFYAERNKSYSYSKKLYSEIESEIRRINKNPYIGKETDIAKVRGLVVNQFIVFYELTTQYIVIHKLWDSRQNPDDLVLK